MIDVALLSVIRRWHFRDGMPIREITRRTGLSRNTVRKYLASRPNIHVEWLPPYAPDLNPVEWLWKLLKYDRLANHGCLSIDQLQALFDAEYRDVISEQDLLRSCIEGSELPLQLSTGSGRYLNTGQ